LPSSYGKLLGLLVGRVLAARIAKLGELETSSRGLLVLSGRVVPVLAFRTLQADDLAHTLLLTWPATSAGKQLAIGKPADTPRRRVTAPAALIPELSWVSDSGRPSWDPQRLRRLRPLIDYLAKQQKAEDAPRAPASSFISVTCRRSRAREHRPEARAPGTAALPPVPSRSHQSYSAAPP
jgi:hypothetical protein